MDAVLCRVICGLCIFDRRAIGVDFSAQDIGIGRRQRGGKPLDAHEHIAIPGGRG